MSATVDLTLDLLSRNSVTPPDQGCQEVMTRRLAEAGFQVENLRYGMVDNFWATRGKGGPVLCFAGHTDVVPTGPLEEWHSDPFKPAVRENQTISGEPFRWGSTGAPVLERTPAYVECRLVDTIEKGDHSVFLGEVVDAGQGTQIEGRADDATLWLKELGPNVFYGG